MPFDTPSLARVAHAIFFAVTLLAIWGSAIIAVHVARAVYANKFESVWPIKALRLAVAVLVTTFFVPCFTLLLTPFSCSSMRVYYGAAYMCSVVRAAMPPPPTHTHTSVVSWFSFSRAHTGAMRACLDACN